MITNPSILKCVGVADQRVLVEVWNLLTDIVSLLKKYEQSGLEVNYRCHSICTALARNMPQLKLVDGLYLGLMTGSAKEGMQEYTITTCEHSWLLTKDDVIIDPYPVGTTNLAPVAIPKDSGLYTNFARTHYVEDETVARTVYTPEIILECDMLAEAMREVLAKSRSVEQLNKLVLTTI